MDASTSITKPAAQCDDVPQADHTAQQLELKDCVKLALDQARMILPGIQTLFGFQLIAVFNERFNTELNEWQQAVHLAALLLVATACALLMAPAAYHRQAEQGQVSQRMFSVTSWLISAGLVPLLVGICLDVYVVSYMVTHQHGWGVGLGAATFCVFFGLWFAFPWAVNRQGAAAR